MDFRVRDLMVKFTPGQNVAFDYPAAEWGYNMQPAVACPYSCTFSCTFSRAIAAGADHAGSHAGALEQLRDELQAALQVVDAI
jgi:hypothetical protein